MNHINNIQRYVNIVSLAKLRVLQIPVRNFVVNTMNKEANNTDIVRCEWVNKDPIYITYHDEEWGIPQYDDLKLFEMLCLEGQQAGLSWITILKKRNNYRKLFHNFNPNKTSKMTTSDVERIVKDPGIVRHRGKIEAIINNANCYLKMEEDGENFSDFIWSYVDHKPIINNWSSIKETPTETTNSKALSKALQTKGFKFIGSKICYAFMQACGLVDDHTLNCVSRTKKKLK